MNLTTYRSTVQPLGTASLHEPCDIIWINEDLIRRTIKVKIDQSWFEIVPIWIEAYYCKKGSTKNAVNPCHQVPSQLGASGYGIRFHKWGIGFDIVLSNDPNYYYSVLIKACTINGEPHKQKSGAKVLIDARKGVIKDGDVEITGRVDSIQTFITKRVLRKTTGLCHTQVDYLYSSLRKVYFSSKTSPRKANPYGCRFEPIDVLDGNPVSLYDAVRETQLIV